MDLPENTNRLIEGLLQGFVPLDAQGEDPETTPEDAPDEFTEADIDSDRDSDSDTETDSPSQDLDASPEFDEDQDLDLADASEASSDAAANADAEADTVDDLEDAEDGATETTPDSDSDADDDAAADLDADDFDFDLSQKAHGGEDDVEAAPDPESEAVDVDEARAEGRDIPFDDTRRERDERAEKYGGSYPSDEIRSFLKQSGIAQRVQEELEDLFSGDRTRSQSIRNERDDTGMVGALYDMRQLTRRMAGDLRVRDIYHDPKPGTDDDLAVGIVLDLSSSMAGEPERDAKAAAGAFLFGIELFGGDVVAVSYPNVSRTQLMTAPGERFEWRHLDSGSAVGGTPTSTAVEDGANLLSKVNSDRYLLIVLTDGGAKNVPATRSVVDEIRDWGREWSVIGFGYGNISERKLSSQFGDDGYRHVDLEDLPEALVDVYREQASDRVVA